MRPSLRDRVLGPSCCAHRTNCTLDCSHRRYYAARRRRAGRKGETDRPLTCMQCTRLALMHEHLDPRPVLRICKNNRGLGTL